MFEEVAKSYDIMNDAMSLGIHRVWKDQFMERLGPTHGTRLLDMAGGTGKSATIPLDILLRFNNETYFFSGDVAFRYINYINNLPPPSSGNETIVAQSHVTISDINQHMLDVGRGRADSLGYTNPDKNPVSVDWVCANAEKLPFDDNTFTAYTIAFGIRNCTHIDRVLSEAYRVLKPGGRFMCLEFSHLNNETLQWQVFSKHLKLSLVVTLFILSLLGCMINTHLP